MLGFYVIIPRVNKKHIESFAKYAGLVTICFEWLAIVLFYILRPSAFSGENPISYFASFPETRAVFSVCLTIAALSFWVFAHYHLPKYYTVPVRLFAASMLGYAILALAPFDPSNVISNGAHVALALFFSLTFLAGIYIIGKKNKDPQVRFVSYLAVVLSGLVMLLFFMAPKDSELVLLLEAASVFVGQLWVIWISFHSFKAERERALGT